MFFFKKRIKCKINCWNILGFKKEKWYNMQGNNNFGRWSNEKGYAVFNDPALFYVCS